MAFGGFNLDFDQNVAFMDLLEEDVEADEWLSTIYLNDLVPVASTLPDKCSSNMEKYLHRRDDTEDADLPPPETPAAPLKKRFKKVSDEEMGQFESKHQSDSTKRNTRWGTKILQDWHTETYGAKLDMQKVKPEELSVKLTKFYCEAKPKDTEKRSENMPPKQADEYHKNSLRNIRAAVNRHLQDIGQTIDIVNDKDFKKANRVLDGMLKNRTQCAASRPTQHKPVIENTDLQKINTYFSDSAASPIKLRQCVWFNLAIHFVTRGIEFHHQLCVDSFEFNTDEGLEFVTLTHETQQQNFQGGLNSKEAMADKRMYATGDENCPVALLKLLLQKTDTNAKSLFNVCVKEALISPTHFEIWYSSKPLGKTSFKGFMSDISKSAKCTKRYTAHCLRATSIQAMNDAGFEARHSMYMSGHRNEASIRSYNRDCSTAQKKNMSSILSDVATGNKIHGNNIVPRMPVSSQPAVNLSNDTVSNVVPTNLTKNGELENFDVSAQFVNQSNQQELVSNDESAHPFHINSSIMSSVHATAGILSHSHFNNCNFHFSR